MIAAIDDLPAQLPACLDSVGRGESVVLTRNGKPVCRLVPIEAERPIEDPTHTTYRRAHEILGRSVIPDDFDAPSTELWDALR